MKAILAWTIINFAYQTRMMYAALAHLMNSRVFVGTNPLKTLMDGFIMILVGVLMIFIPVFGMITFPISAIVLVFRRSEYLKVKALADAGRVDWVNGRVEDKPQEEKVEPDAPEGN